MLCCVADVFEVCHLFVSKVRVFGAFFLTWVPYGAYDGVFHMGFIRRCYWLILDNTFFNISLQDVRDLLAPYYNFQICSLRCVWRAPTCCDTCVLLPRHIVPPRSVNGRQNCDHVSRISVSVSFLRVFYYVLYVVVCMCCRCLFFFIFYYMLLQKP